MQKKENKPACRLCGRTSVKWLVYSKDDRICRECKVLYEAEKVLRKRNLAERVNRNLFFTSPELVEMAKLCPDGMFKTQLREQYAQHRAANYIAWVGALNCILFGNSHAN